MSSVDPGLLDRVRLRLAEAGAEPTPLQVAAALRLEGGLVGDAAVLEMLDALRRDIGGAGPLEPLLRRPGVTDVLVNGPDDIFVDCGAGLERADVTFPDDAAVRRLAQRLAAAAGRRLDDAAPFVDVRLPDGSRFHAVLSPVARPGTCLSLRVPPRTGMSLDDLAASGSLDRRRRDLLQEIVTRRLAFLVTGGTGSGKTTLLAALLAEVDARERLVVVEDAAELCLRHPHVVSLEARRANVEGSGEITLRRLVREALRMRPDRLVVGEVRGPEVTDLLTALNTGHEGGCATVHANTPRDVPSRIEALAGVDGPGRDAVQAQFASAISVVVHLRRNLDGRRWLSEVAVVSPAGAGGVAVHTAVSFDRHGTATPGDAAPALRALVRGGHP